MDPVALMAAVEAAAGELDKGGKALSAAIRELGEAESNYEREFEKALLQLYAAHKERGERMPGEDMRRALSHQKISEKTLSKYLVAKANVKAIEGRLRAIQAATSARQSLLSTLRAEHGIG